MISGAYAILIFFLMSLVVFDYSYAFSSIVGNVIQYTLVAIATYLVFVGLKKSNLGIM